MLTVTEPRGVRTFKGGDSNWRIQHPDTDVISPNSFHAGMENGGPYHAAFVKETSPDGSQYDSLKFIEHDGGKDRVGDVVITFRVDPQTGRYTVQAEQEDVFLDETTKIQIWRAVRSSLANIAQAVKRTVVNSGQVYANPRRIGGKSIFTHYVLAGPLSQEVPGKIQMDVYEYVQGLDALGLAAFVKALQHMPEKPARAIFNQMRQPAM